MNYSLPLVHCVDGCGLRKLYNSVTHNFIAKTGGAKLILPENSQVRTVQLLPVEGIAITYMQG